MYTLPFTAKNPGPFFALTFRARGRARFYSNFERQIFAEYFLRRRRRRRLSLSLLPDAGNQNFARLCAAPLKDTRKDESRAAIMSWRAKNLVSRKRNKFLRRLLA